MSKVSLVKCNDYENVKSAIKKSLQSLGGLKKFIKKNDKVLIKPNMMEPLEPDKAATTHPLFVKAVIELVKEIANNVFVGDSSAGSSEGFTKRTLEVSGIGKVIKEKNVVFRNFQEEEFIVKDIPNYKVLEKTDFAKAIFEADVIINLPKLKTHTITFLTGAVKNCFGCVHYGERQYLHREFKVEDFCQGIVDVFSIIKPQLNIMDAVIGMEGDEGPSYGNPKNIGYVIASEDAVALDAVAAKLTGHDPFGILTIKYAHLRGLGIGNINEINLLGDKFQTIKDFKQHSLYKNRFDKFKGKLQPEITEKCVKCGSCFKSCPMNAIEKINNKYVINEDKCIQCCCCLEVCAYGGVRLRKITQPKKVNGHYIVKINNKCNSNCYFCADSKEVRNQPDFNYSTLIRDLEEKRKKFDTLIISGGEPTIYKNIFKYIRCAKNICKYKHITLTTNGFLLAYEDFTDRLISNGVDSFIISFITSNEKVYDIITKVKGSFKYVTKALLNLKNRNKQIRINTVLHKLNYKDTSGIVSFLIRKGVDAIQLSFMNPIGSSVVNGKSTLAITYNEVMPYIKDAFKIANKLNFNKLYIENFPICTAKEFVNKISDLKKPDENKAYYNACKTKSEKCKKCIYFDDCDGVWEAYIKQFGDKEIKPIRKETYKIQNKVENKGIKHNNNKHIPKISHEAGNSYDSRYFEWAGLEKGFKRASIFYLKKNEISNFKGLLKKKGYFFEISDFAYNYNNGFTKKTYKKINDSSMFSVYVSKEKSICKQLKYLDKYHQFTLNEPSGKTRKEIFFEIGKLLGYPRCCSEFIQSVHEKPEFKADLKLYGKYFDDETLYPMMALKQSRHINHFLNNFSSNVRLIDSFVCSYSCENALKLAHKVLGYLKDKNVKYDKVISKLKRPLVFFSPKKIIYLTNVRKIKGKIYYSNCFLEINVPDDTAEYRQFSNKIFSKFLKGNSFSITDQNIKVYNNNTLLFTIKKKHKYDGVFIQFD